MSVGFFYNYKKHTALSGSKLLYHGTWHGQSVVFDRAFRGHILTSGECMALCDGELLFLFGLQRGGSSYGVRIALVQPTARPVDNDAFVLHVKVFDVLVDRTDYVFEERDVVYLDDFLANQSDDPVSESGFMSHSLPGVASVAGSVLDAFSDTFDAQLSANVAGLDTVPIKSTSYIVHDNIRVFVPVYSGVPGYDPDISEDVEYEDKDTEFVSEENVPGVLVGGFSFDMDSGAEEPIVVESNVDSDSGINVTEDRSDDFADLEYLDDPLADPDYDPNEAEIQADYDTDD